MAAATVAGVYKRGKIELLEVPKGVREGPVRVTVTEEEPAKPEPRYLQYGKYKGGRQSTLEDFKEAEFHGEPEFDDLYGE